METSSTKALYGNASRREAKGKGFLAGVCARHLFPLPALLLLFPTLSVFFAAVGLLFGVAVSGVWALLGLICTVGLGLVGGGSYRDGMKRIGWFLLSILIVFLVDQSFVMFSWWDAQAYHLPAAKFLLEGWNPVFESTREALLRATGADYSTFNAFHTAYLPRGGWIWSAITASFTGNLELGDSLILLTAMALGGLAWKVTPLLFGPGRWKTWVFSGLLVFSPGVMASVFCGAQDGALYALLLISMLAACAYRKTRATGWLSFVAITPILGCNLKFTGAISLVLSAMVFSLPILWCAFRGKGGPRAWWKWVAANTVGFVFALMVGFSPYLTNWANHGGPFYPEHSFSKNEPLPAMTADFNLTNDDAAAMGYVGRFVHAYISKSLAQQYYEWKLDKKPFNPVWHLDQVGGLGTGFRIIMCLTLLTLCFTRRCGTPWLIAVILLTSLLVPTKMMGYVRYVPQLWLFPVLIAFNAMTVNVPRSPWVGRSLGVMLTSVMATSTLLFALFKLTMAMGMSMYALSLLESMQSEAHPRVYVLSLHDRYRVDGRCLPAWETLWRGLPEEERIPATHVFDTYYHTMLPACGVRSASWQTPVQMRALRDPSSEYYEPAIFYLGEHLWYWPEDPMKVRLPDMHYYAGQPRRAFGLKGTFFVAGQVLKELPRYLWHMTVFRWHQLTE